MLLAVRTLVCRSLCLWKHTWVCAEEVCRVEEPTLGVVMGCVGCVGEYTWGCIRHSTASFGAGMALAACCRLGWAMQCSTLAVFSALCNSQCSRVLLAPICVSLAPCYPAHLRCTVAGILMLCAVWNEQLRASNLVLGCFKSARCHIDRVEGRLRQGSPCLYHKTPKNELSYNHKTYKIYKNDTGYPCYLFGAWFGACPPGFFHLDICCAWPPWAKHIGSSRQQLCLICILQPSVGSASV